MKDAIRILSTVLNREDRSFLVTWSNRTGVKSLAEVPIWDVIDAYAKETQLIISYDEDKETVTPLGNAKEDKEKGYETISVFDYIEKELNFCKNTFDGVLYQLVYTENKDYALDLRRFWFFNALAIDHDENMITAEVVMSDAFYYRYPTSERFSVDELCNAAKRTGHAIEYDSEAQSLLMKNGMRTVFVDPSDWVKDYYYRDWFQVVLNDAFSTRVRQNLTKAVDDVYFIDFEAVVESRDYREVTIAAVECLLYYLRYLNGRPLDEKKEKAEKLEADIRGYKYMQRFRFPAGKAKANIQKEIDAITQHIENELL